MKKTIEKLQLLLAESSVFRQNLYSHHWNILGPKFFFMHTQLGEMYDGVGEDIDMYAERILALGGTPEHKFSEYLKVSAIEESPILVECGQIEADTLDSLKKTHVRLYECIRAAEEEDDQGTIDMIGSKIACIEKTIWMWSAQQSIKVGGGSATNPKSKPKIDIVP